jgi:hypothetical protein
MKKINLIIITALIMFLSACQKDKITVTLNTSGSLTVQIADNTGNKFQNIKVHLYTYISSNGSQVLYSGELDSKSTDANGNVNFGTLEAGSYYLVTDTVKNGNKKYLIAKAVQVISGNAKSLVLNPLEYIGTIRLHVNIYTSGTDTLDRTTLKVALVNYKDYVSKDNRQKVINKAVDIESCDANGYVEFKNVPSNIQYYAYVYINNNDTIGAWSGGSFMVSKDDIYSDYFSVNLSSLIVIKTSVNLTIEYNSYVYPYGYQLVQSVNVVLINYDDYYTYSLSYASQTTILSHAIVSGITNSSGVVTFANVPANFTYYVYVYFNSTYHTWASSNIYPYSGSSNYYTRDVYGSDLGLSK